MKDEGKEKTGREESRWAEKEVEGCWEGREKRQGEVMKMIHREGKSIFILQLEAKIHLKWEITDIISHQRSYRSKIKNQTSYQKY